MRASCGYCTACASNQMLRRTAPTAERTVTPMWQRKTARNLVAQILTAIRVVLGVSAPVPYRAGHAEAALTGRRADEPVANEAARVAVQGATPLSRNGYKLPLFET